MFSKKMRMLALVVLAVGGVSARADRPVAVPINLSQVDLASNGKVATGTALENNTVTTYIWKEGLGKQSLGRGAFPGTGLSRSSPKISADGRTIAQTILSDSGTSSTAGVWTRDGGWRELGPLPPGGGGLDQYGADSYSYAISKDGKVVTGAYHCTTA